ncbi:MAG: hypothetical protein WB586_02375 [Chthoniobacterales bacterium]
MKPETSCTITLTKSELNLLVSGLIVFEREQLRLANLAQEEGSTLEAVATVGIGMLYLSAGSRCCVERVRRSMAVNDPPRSAGTTAARLSFRGRKNHSLVLFNLAGPRISSTKMKPTRTRAHYLSRVLEAALDMGLVIVIGYGLILLSQSQALF